MGETLFNRSWAVTIGETETTELDVKFKIEKSLKPEPNKGEVTIYNMNEQQRYDIEQLNPKTKRASYIAGKKVRKALRKQATEGIPCRVEAGYGGKNSLIWLGDMREAESVLNGTDWETIVKSGDGEKAWQNARLHVSYGPGTPKSIALRAMVAALGIKPGNVDQAAAALGARGLTFKQGTVFSGPVARMLTDFCKSANLEWWMEDGQLRIVDHGAALATTAFLINSNTGLESSPTSDADGYVKFKVLLTPDMFPGRIVVVDSKRVQGNYRIAKCTYNGDSAGTDWSVECECEPYPLNDTSPAPVAAPKATPSPPAVKK